MKKFTVAAFVLLAFLTAFAPSVWANNPPRIIGNIIATPPDTMDFGSDFCCVGDHNGDGYDDLLVNHGTWEARHGDRIYSNSVKLFLGGEMMQEEPAFILAGPPQGPICFGKRIMYLGRLTSSDNPFWAIQAQEDIDVYVNHFQIRIYEAGEELDTIPEYTVLSENNQGFFLGTGQRNQPCDLNGDGYNDLVTIHHSAVSWDSSTVHLEAFYGGEEFDCVSDFSVNLHTNNSSYIRDYWDYSSGFDVNNDGYHDLLLKSVGRDRDNLVRLSYLLYLGGDPMDTTEVWEVFEDHFEGDTVLTEGGNMRNNDFAMLSDVNGDGYDDWAIHYFCESSVNRPYYIEGCFLFFGSDNPDPEPDRVLPGLDYLWGTYGKVTGGDVNGDGFGDVVCSNMDGFRWDGEIHVFFGSHWFSDVPGLIINPIDEYGPLAQSMGRDIIANGDYNNDGVTDIVAPHYGHRFNAGHTRVYALAGSSRWRVSVDEENQTIPAEMNLTSYPNPFNESVMIKYNIRSSGLTRLTVFDVRGRVVADLVDDFVPTGEHSLVWTAPESGVYIVRLASGDRITARKLVCVK